MDSFQAFYKSLVDSRAGPATAAWFEKAKGDIAEWIRAFVSNKRRKWRSKLRFLHKSHESALAALQACGRRASDTAVLRLSGRLRKIEVRLTSLYHGLALAAMERAKVRWATLGERATKYFFGLEPKERGKPVIERIEDGAGGLATGKAAVCASFVQFYESLYAPEPVCPAAPLDDGGWPHVAGGLRLRGRARSAAHAPLRRDPDM